MAKWAKENGCSGIKHYGALDIVGGVTAEPYVNLIIFEQATLDAALYGVTPALFKKLINSDKQIRFAKRSIFHSFPSRQSKKAQEPEMA